MIWDIAALVFSLLAAVAIHLNHIFRLDGMVLVCLRSVATAFLFLPFGLLLPWPEDWRFYLCAALVGLCGNLADRLVFDSAATYGSRLTCLYVPLKIWLAFVLWTVLDPASLTALADPAWKIPAILGCLGLTTAAVFLLRKNDASWCALAHLAPVGVLLAGADIFVKKGMAPYDILPYALVFTFFISVSQVVWSFILFGFYNKATLGDIFTGRNFKPFWVSGVVYCGLFLSATVAMALTPNPAYVNAILMLNVVWLMIFYRLFGIKDDGRPWVGLLFVASAVGIVLLVN